MPKDQFRSARLRLTLVYVAILAIILFISSSALYSAFSTRLQHRFERFRTRFVPPIVSEDIILPRQEDVREDLVNSLILANSLLLVIAGIISYWLAGLTLEPIEEAYDRQRRFLSDASHELRTPLAILQTDLENELSAPNLTPTNAERAKSHLEEVERMANIVANLLTLSRLDEHAVATEELRDVALEPTIQKAIDRLQSIAARNNVTLEFTSGNALHIRAHEDLLLQALSNVIKNAIAYNVPGGSVHITSEATDGKAHVTVTDTGVGIAHDDIEKIFQRFYRADKSRSRQTGGSGLGLSIVQSIMNQFHGTVEISSEPEKGTSVMLIFPLA